MKLMIGSNITNAEGWTRLDIDPICNPDILADALEFQLPPDTVEEIYASAILEHFTQAQCRDVLSRWYNMLQPGGKLWVSVPDMVAFSKYIINITDINKINASIEILYSSQNNHFLEMHKTGFTYDTMTSLLSDIGFKQFALFTPWVLGYPSIGGCDCFGGWLPGEEIIITMLNLTAIK